MDTFLTSTRTVTATATTPTMSAAVGRWQFGGQVTAALVAGLLVLIFGIMAEKRARRTEQREVNKGEKEEKRAADAERRAKKAERRAKEKHLYEVGKHQGKCLPNSASYIVFSLTMWSIVTMRKQKKRIAALKKQKGALEAEIVDLQSRFDRTVDIAERHLREFRAALRPEPPEPPAPSSAGVERDESP